MISLNKVFLAGNLTRDPEVRYTPSGTAVADLNMAINRVYTSGGEQKEDTCFVNVVVWGRQAETSGQYLSKGAPVLIEGSLQYDQWQTDSGDKRSRLRVRADRVQFLGAPRKSDFGAAPRGPQDAPDVGGPGGEAAPRQEGSAGPVDDDLPF